MGSPDLTFDVGTRLSGSRESCSRAFIQSCLWTFSGEDLGLWPPLSASSHQSNSGVNSLDAAAKLLPLSCCLRKAKGILSKPLLSFPAGGYHGDATGLPNCKYSQIKPAPQLHTNSQYGSTGRFKEEEKQEHLPRANPSEALQKFTSKWLLVYWKEQLVIMVNNHPQQNSSVLRCFMLKEWVQRRRHTVHACGPHCQGLCGPGACTLLPAWRWMCVQG